MLVLCSLLLIKSFNIKGHKANKFGGTMVQKFKSSNVQRFKQTQLCQSLKPWQSPQAEPGTLNLELSNL